MEDTSIQVVHREGRDGRRGAVVETVTGLVPGSTVEGARLFAAAPVLSRVATLSDLHVGEPGFGLRHGIAEPRGTKPSHTVRAARAALAEAAAWGAQLVVVKGDLTWSARVLQWESVAEILAASPVRVVVTLGNHDVGRKGIDGRTILTDAGLHVVDGVEAFDLPGVRVVVVDTAVRGESHGSVPPAARDRAAALASAAPEGCGVLVTMHHYPDRFAVPTRYPRGIPQPESDALLAALAPSRPLVTCGHTHRHRRYERSGVTVTEVGATKDFPGVWAGYTVDPAGIRQVVRRIEEPSVVAWTERTAALYGGAWGWWTPGRRSWRCFRMEWSR